MRRQGWEWHPRPPTRTMRIVAAIWLVVMLVIAASYKLGWGLLGNHDKDAVIVLTALGLFLFFGMFPRVRRN